MIQKVPPDLVESNKLINSISKFHSQDKHNERKGKFGVSNEDSKERVEEFVSFGRVWRDGLFETELHGDQDTESCKEEEGSEETSSFLFFEDSAITLIIIEDVGFHELTFTFILIVAVLTLTIDQWIDSNVLLFLLFYILVDLWLFAWYHYWPYDEDRQPDGENDDSENGQSVRIFLREIIDFTVPEIQGYFHVFLGTLTGHAKPRKIVDVGGGIFYGNQIVGEICLLLAFIELAWIVGGDAGVHDGRKGDGGYVEFEYVFDEFLYEFLAFLWLTVDH